MLEVQGVQHNFEIKGPKFRGRVRDITITQARCLTISTRPTWPGQTRVQLPINDLIDQA